METWGFYIGVESETRRDLSQRTGIGASTTAWYSGPSEPSMGPLRPLKFRVPNISMYVYNYIYIYIYNYIYIYIHTRTHIYIYIYIERERYAYYSYNSYDSYDSCNNCSSYNCYKGAAEQERPLASQTSGAAERSRAEKLAVALGRTVQSAPMLSIRRSLK